MSGFSAITYNLWHGRGERDLPSLVQRYGPDVLQLQEAPLDRLPDRIGPLARVVMSSGEGFGVALFVRDDRFRIEDAAAVHLPRSLHDRIRATTAERFAAARVLDASTGERLVVGTLHATPLTDPNVVRRRQVDAAHRALDDLGPGLPALVAGDFNYPYFPRSLDRRLHRLGYRAARSGVGTFHGRGMARGAFDIAIVRGVAVEAAVTLPRGASDHRPVRFQARIGRPGRPVPIR